MSKVTKDVLGGKYSAKAGLGLKSHSKHTTNPTEGGSTGSSTNGGSGTRELTGAHGSKSKRRPNY